MVTKRHNICLSTMVLAFVVSNIFLISSNHWSIDCSKPKPYLKSMKISSHRHSNVSDVKSKSEPISLQNSSKEQNDKVERSKEVKPKSELKSLQTNSREQKDTVERLNLEVKPTSELKTLQNQTLLHKNDTDERLRLGSEPTSLQNSFKQRKDTDDRSKLEVKADSDLQTLQNNSKQNTDKAERPKLEVKPTSELKTFQHKDDTDERPKLDVQPKPEPKGLQNSSKQHNDKAERSNLDLKAATELQTLQNNSKQEKDTVEQSKLEEPTSKLKTQQNQSEHQKATVERSELDVKPKSDLNNAQNNSKQYNGDKVHNKLPIKGPLATELVIKKDQKKLPIKPGPLYSDEVINPYPFKLVRSPAECRIVSPPYGNVFLVVLVACRHKEVKDRSLIRRTWGKVKVHEGKSILVRFLVGLPHTLNEENVIQKETAEYGDIIQGDFFDSYKNMTLKVLLGLKWAGLKCPNATYVMNLDSDMFVNVYNLVTLLTDSPRVEFAKGNLKPFSRPLRHRHSKWYTPVDMYPEPSYPPYLNGPAYVMSGDLPVRIFNESVHVRYIPWDDVFIGLVMKKIKVSPVRGRHFEDKANLKRPQAVLGAIRRGIATHVGHQVTSNPVLVEMWKNISANIKH